MVAGGDGRALLEGWQRTIERCCKAIKLVHIEELGAFLWWDRLVSGEKLSGDCGGGRDVAAGCAVEAAEESRHLGVGFPKTFDFPYPKARLS